jgi:periplasmic protein TonB
MNLPASSASVGLHVAIAIGLMLATGRHLDDGSHRNSTRSASVLLLPLFETGNPGGKEGGGDRNPNPPQSARNVGPGRIALSPIQALDPSPDEIRPSRDPVQEVDLPTVPESTGLTNLPGAVTALVTPETGSRGPGDGPAVGSARGPGYGEGDVGRGLNRGPGGPGDGGIEPPVVIKQVKPAYTTAALQARIQGAVLMDVVVLPDGSVGDVRIIRSLDREKGLDEEAIKAVKQWRFRPGTRLGRPIPVLVSVELTFTLR